MFNSKSHYKFDLKGGDKMEKAQLFWQTYLNLEKEFLDVAKYIYITDESISYSKNRLIKSHCKTQLETFSPLIADLLIRTCIEIEAISKELYYDFGGEKSRGGKDIFFDEDCLKLIDIKCQTHKKVVMVSCSAFNLTKDENVCFKPLREAHKRQGTNWEKAYQAVKHDRYASISQGTVKNLLHAMGALYLLNIYLRKPKLTSKYLEVSNLDFSLGSSIFSVKRPNDKYVISIINNQDIADVLQSDDSPFILKYTDSYYKQVLEANKTMLDEMNNYWVSQPELKEIDFLQQLMRAKEREAKDPRQKLMPLWELSQYRLWKRVPTNLPFEERKKLFISSPEWNGQIRQLNHHLTADELNEDNIQSEIDHAGILYGIELQKRFENVKMYKAFNEAYCELILDTGDIRYNK